MLFRNTDWSRNLLDMAAQFGQFPANMSTEQVSARQQPLHVLPGASLTASVCRLGSTMKAWPASSIPM